MAQTQEEWARARDTILRMEADGTITPSGEAWLQDWRKWGSPDTKAELVAAREADLGYNYSPSPEGAQEGYTQEDAVPSDYSPEDVSPADRADWGLMEPADRTDWYVPGGYEPPGEYDTGYADYDYSMLNQGFRDKFDKMRADYGDEAFFSSEVLRNRIRQLQGQSQGIDVLAKETAGGPLVVGGSGGGSLPDGTPVDEWTGQWETGNTPPPGYVDPTAPPVVNDPYNPPVVDDPFVPTGPGTGDPGPGGGGGDFSWADNPLIGWEGLDDTDFYQQQFKDMRDRSDNERSLAYAAALRGQEAPAAQTPSDPWSWTDLPDVQMGTGAPSKVPTGEYQLNPNYGLSTDMSGRDIYSALLPTLNDQERVFANKHLDYFDQLDLSKGYEGVQDWMSSNPYTNDKGWTATLGDIGGNIYNQIYETTGPQAPVGYAAPISL